MSKSKLPYICTAIIALNFFTVFGSSQIAKSETSNQNFVIKKKISSSFTIVENSKTADIFVDPGDWKGVIRAVNDLGDDIGKVSGVPSKIFEKTDYIKGSIIAGTIGKSRIIDKYIEDKRLDVSEIKGKWESFIIQTVDGNLIIAGSDKRGTIFGIYDISEKIGVSPWYWWADVPVKKSNSLFVKAGKYIQYPPKVKYRGIFINDEEPSFGQWSRNKFGGINSKMYSHMFELILRLKANYLWPAMWGKAFNEDDLLNPVVADEYGIVMGTSHHEPMMRAQNEYTNRKNEVGPWNYSENKERLDKFFTEGLERNKAFDNMITIGMRGEGDVEMSKEGDAANIKILGNVVKSQREIIENIFKKNATEVPQLWAIFTEVQRYYDAGFTVPDDVLLLFCDNNWGYIRRIGPLNERNRKGGMGLYYHIDMNGGPWNDRWINTTTIQKLHQQFNLAYRTGLDDLWIINVGDLKPKELPIDFIMKYAWNPDAYNPENLRDYTKEWAAKIFGVEFSEEISDLVSKYPKYNFWRKPEVQDTKIFSHVNYRESDRILKMWKNLTIKAENLKLKIPSNAQDAFYQLVYYPVIASAGVAEIYLAAGKNNIYAKQGRISANDYAARVKELFETDKKLSDFYNNELSAGKWKNMMQDIHMGYTQWSMPKESKHPELINVEPLPQPTMGIALEGSELSWPESKTKAELPTFDLFINCPYFIDVFNKGIGSFQYSATASDPWIKLSKSNGTVNKEDRIEVTIDWKKIPANKATGNVTISHGDVVVSINVNAIKAEIPKLNKPFFGNLTGEFSIPANKFNSNISGKEAKWIVLPGLGRAEACMGIHPVTAPSATAETAPRLEYNVYFPESKKYTICLGILPTQDVFPQRGLRIGVALNNGEIKIIDARQGLVDEFKEYTPSNISSSKVLKPLPKVNQNISLIAYRQRMRNEIFDNIRWLDVELEVNSPGINVLKVFMIDPEIVLENIIINPDSKYPSYFGAPPVQHNNK